MIKYKKKVKRANWVNRMFYQKRKVSWREKERESGKLLSYVTEFHYILMILAKVRFYFQKKPFLYKVPFKINLI